MRFVLLIFTNPRNPNSKRMSRLANNLENASKREEYSDKKCGYSFTVECGSLKKPRAKNSRMSQEGNRFNVGRTVVHRPICLQFHRWGNCGFGERCRYVHTTGGSTYGPPQGIGCDQRYVEGGKGEYRETAAITIGTAGNEVKNKSYADNVEPKRSLDFRRNLKTRLCIRWERDGSCPYGSRCQFAHGKGELQVVGHSNPPVSLSSAGISAPAENVASNETGSSAPSKLRFKWNDVHKIKGIYVLLTDLYRTPYSRRMNRPDKNLEVSECNSNAGCESLKKQNSRMAREGENRESSARTILDGESTEVPSRGIGFEEGYLADGEDENRGYSAIKIETREPKRPVDFHTKRKTKLCTLRGSDGTCVYGAKCTYVHGIAELRSLDFSNPPESQRSADISAPSRNVPARKDSSNPPESQSSVDISAPARNVPANEIVTISPANCRFKWNDIKRDSRIYGD